MDENEIQSRLLFLHTALQYDTQYNKKLTLVERIFVNQERGGLLDCLNYLHGELDRDDVRTQLVEQSEIINKKLNKIHADINKNNLHFESSKNE